MARQKKQASIVSRVVLPLLLTSVMHAVLIIGILAVNGVFDDIKANALHMLDERTQNKYQTLQTEMTLNWSYLAGMEQMLLNRFEKLMAAQGKTFADIKTDAALNAQLVREAANELILRMRENDTTGIFLILNGIGVIGKPDTYAGLYIRDTDPNADASDNSDLHILRALPPLTRELGLSLDSFWQACFTFPGSVSNPDNAYFYMPLYAAGSGKSTDGHHNGYWSLPFRINGADDSRVITYTQPLRNRAGEVYGVIGVEINENYLISVLNRGEFARNTRGGYFLGMTTDGGLSYRRVTTVGTVYKQFFRAEDTLLAPFTVQETGHIRIQSVRGREVVYGSVMELTLYPSNTPFSTQHWVLIGLEDETTLFAFANQVWRLFLIGALFAAILSASIAWLIGRNIVRPFVRLAGSLRASDPNHPLGLQQTGITEVDALADALVEWNHSALEAAGRLSRVLRSAKLPVGVFEVRDDNDMAFCSDGLFRLLGRTEQPAGDNLIPKEQCWDMVNAVMQNKVEESFFRIPGEGAPRFVRVEIMQEENGVVGTVMDVTSEVEDRHRIERERDHDLLTGILNRRAFDSSAEGLFIRRGAALGVAAVIMLDLDNLKYLNDTYGHDCGDGYIRTFAEALRLFGMENALVARRSGDEFLVLLHGGKTKAEMRERVQRAWKGIVERTYQLPDGTLYQLRVSGGLAWFPDDADNLNQLIQYADFAMYKVKRNAKGTLEEFNFRDYSEDAFLISGRDALDRMIDKQLVRFALQPILSASTGDVYGYELLMRTNVRELPDPTTVLRLASAEGKLQHIERLTWFKGLETIRQLTQNQVTQPHARFFLNSIANHVLTEDEEAQLTKGYRALFSRLVVEVTEGERNNEAYTRRKLEFVRRHGGLIAIDDYGTGYNSEVALIQINADIVKLDISFVHGVDADEDKQVRIQSLISYAKDRGIAVLAEGVETSEELQTLIQLGVDYLQGYYLGAPQYQPMEPDDLLRQEIRRLKSRAEDAAQ